MRMFAGTTRGPQTFRSLRPKLFEPTKVPAANQVPYNGFLAVSKRILLVQTGPALLALAALLPA